ncbi:site-specific integrase [Aliiglaciecola sp. LCG003]|uniref:site-specific integrase n=1 Tax=Aliiglaciecola sp. LCG003 TaxID=3053655 RepID=UPI002573ABF6|nr:site-specific integrase [Aliiglaciecola sp. LCG003]WJG07736.1 site-specific integrase [Aliiglaciecola sp. LCG003]
MQVYSLETLIEKELNQLEEDSLEYAQSSLEDTLNISKSKNKKVSKVPLLSLLNERPDGNFPVTDKSKFGDERWDSDVLQRLGRNQFIMSSSVLGGELFAKCYTYYLLPGNNPYGKITSWLSTDTYFYSWLKAIREYVLEPNGLDFTEDSIQAISAKMLNKALDMAEASNVKRHYEFLFHGIIFWLSLSLDGYLPKELSLSDVTLSKIDTKDRRKSVTVNSSKNVNSWKPLSEIELANLMTYSIDWIEVGLPELDIIQKKLKKLKLWNSSVIVGNTEQRLSKISDIFSSTLNDKPIVSIILNHTETTQKGRTYQGWRVNWRKGFRLALNEVKNSLLVTLGVITGMRLRELSSLKFSDFEYIEDVDKWFLDITRFKTTDDPNFFGETDTIEIPNFFGKNVEEYKLIRSEIVERDSEFIFDNNLSREAKKIKRSVGKVFKKLGEQLGIDDLHPHRLRKTTADILIKRSEKNIDIIRMLFGHKSYTMTLRYIARNPYMIGSVASTLEVHFAENFSEIITAVVDGKASGKFAESFGEKFKEEKNKVFRGKLIRMRVFEYIIYLMQSGVPLHVERTTLGNFCLFSGTISREAMPPCLQGRDYYEGIAPELTNCDVACENAVVLEETAELIQKDILFYESLVENTIGQISAKAKSSLIKKIAAKKQHLEKLQKNHNFQDKEKLA